MLFGQKLKGAMLLGFSRFLVKNVLKFKLRMVPPFVTAHTFCASRDIRVS